VKETLRDAAAVEVVAGSHVELTVKAMTRRTDAQRFPRRAVLAFGLVGASLLAGCGQQPAAEPSAQPSSEIVSGVPPEFGVPAFELPDRGRATLRWSGFDGSTPQEVSASDLLPVVRKGADFPYPGGSGDPVVDQFIAASVQLSSTGSAADGKQSTLRLKILRYPGIDPIVVAGIESSLSTLTNMIGGWGDMAETLLFVTDESAEAEIWLRRTASNQGCTVPPRWYPFAATEMPGGVPVQNLCGTDRSGFILNMSQYARISPKADLTAVTRTFVDDLFDQWQFQRRPEVRGSGVEPRWLLQGSQQLPFMFYQASRTGVVEFNPIPQTCTSAGLQGHDFEAFTPNGNNSCPHSLGRMAMLLLVARVGIAPVIDYFSAPAISEDFESRFEFMAGETYEAFSRRFERWMAIRDQAASSDEGFTKELYGELAALLR